MSSRSLPAARRCFRCFRPAAMCSVLATLLTCLLAFGVAPGLAADACIPRATKPWCDVTKTSAERAALLVKAMTLPEKISQISTYTPATVPGVERIGLPAFSYHSEGLHGCAAAFSFTRSCCTVKKLCTGSATVSTHSALMQLYFRKSQPWLPLVI